MPQIQVVGQTVTTTRVNVRQGAPNRAAPVLRKLDAGTTIPVQAIVAGEAVDGNAQWYLTGPQSYVWTGGCGPLAPVSGPQVPDIASPPPNGVGDLGVPANVVDLFHGDRVTSFAQARAAGVVGVIHKATTGQSGKDKLYDARRADALNAGLLWGAYHWGTAAPVDKQLDNFLNTAKPDANTLVALDFETDDGNQMTLDAAREFLKGIEAKLHRRAVLYSGNVIKSALGNTRDPFFGGHKLWLAQYGDHPRVQPSWETFWLWQYTDGTSGPTPRTVPGIPGDSDGRVDCDHFAGSEAQLRAQWSS